MTVSLTHTTAATGSDSGDGKISKNAWNEAHTLEMATARILGRTTAGAGAVEEISVGTGLTLSAGSLVASNVSDTAYGSGWDGDTTTAASKNAVYDKFEGLLHPGFIAANWYLLGCFPGQPLTTATLLADSVYYAPFVLTRRLTLSDLGVRITTATAASNCAAAIYANNASTGRPTGTPLAATGNISTASTGLISADITGANVTLDPGIYWASIWVANATTVFAVGSQASATPAAVLVGSATAGNVIQVAVGLSALTSAEAFNASAWPDATSEAFTEIATVNRQPVIVGKAV